MNSYEGVVAEGNTMRSCSRIWRETTDAGFEATGRWSSSIRRPVTTCKAFLAEWSSKSARGDKWNELTWFVLERFLEAFDIRKTNLCGAGEWASDVMISS